MTCLPDGWHPVMRRGREPLCWSQTPAETASVESQHLESQQIKFITFIKVLLTTGIFEDNINPLVRYRNSYRQNVSTVQYFDFFTDLKSTVLYQYLTEVIYF